MRFKEGDKVRVKKFKERPIGWEIEGKMDHLMGKVVEIKSSTPCGGYNVYDPKHHCEWSFVEDDLEPVNETIVIYRKDREVIAVDNVTGDKAIAKCSTEDTFDFNVGAKLAFDRLMNGNKENITVEDMRKRLNSYCIGRSCCDCKLKVPTYRCVRGADFMSKDDDGNYTMSDEEIKAAFNIVFCTGIKEVKPKETHKFKVGDIVKGNSKSDKKYNITNSNMKRGKVTRVSNDGDTITIEVLEHKNMTFAAGTECGVKSKYFDLVEESTKLYNGKIVFTKGDGTFKTGHIYKVKDGRINVAEYGRVPMAEPLKDIEDVKDYFTGKCDGNRKREKGWSPYTLELIEVKED